MCKRLENMQFNEYCTYRYIAFPRNFNFLPIDFETDFRLLRLLSILLSHCPLIPAQPASLTSKPLYVHISHKIPPQYSILYFTWCLLSKWPSMPLRIFSLPFFLLLYFCFLLFSVCAALTPLSQLQKFTEREREDIQYMMMPAGEYCCVKPK